MDDNDHAAPALIKQKQDLFMNFHARLLLLLNVFVIRLLEQSGNQFSHLTVTCLLSGNIKSTFC